MKTDDLQITVHRKENRNYACFRLPDQPEIKGLHVIFDFSWYVSPGEAGLKETKKLLIQKAQREIRKRALPEVQNWDDSEFATD